MRELTIYYCSRCGRYGYYQITKNAVCPDCAVPMTLFPMNYRDFMDLDYAIRDQLIADQIAGGITPHTSIVQRIFERSSHCETRTEAARYRSALEKLEGENQALCKKNEELEQTITWMHDLIWDLTQRLYGQPHIE